MSAYDAYERLNVVLGTRWEEDGPRQQIFVFADGGYRGTDTAQPSRSVMILRAPVGGTEVTLQYQVFQPEDPRDLPSGSVDVRFVWTGQRFLPLDDIPVADPTARDSRV